MKRILQFVLLIAALACCVSAHAEALKGFHPRAIILPWQFKTITMSQHRSNIACGSVATCAVSGFSAVAAGSFIFGQATLAGSAITASAGASGGGTWVVPSGCTTTSNCSATGVTVEYILSSTGSPTTLSCTATSIGECEIVVYTFTGTSMAFDVGTGGASKSAANPTGVSAGTLTGTNDLIIQYIATAGNVSAAGCPNSAANPCDQPNGNGIGGLVNSTNTAAGTWTATAGAAGAGAIAFKEAAAAGGTTIGLDKRRRYEQLEAE